MRTKFAEEATDDIKIPTMEELQQPFTPPVELPAAGRPVPTTVSEGAPYDYNTWEAIAQRTFPDFHVCRVHKSAPGEVDGQIVNERREQGYVVLYDADIGSPYGPKLKGYEHQQLVGNTNYVLMGLPWPAYQRLLFDLHKRSNDIDPIKLNPEYSEGARQKFDLEETETYKLDPDDR